MAQQLNVDLIGAPRLVRLNPNVPTKTRGNAALVARFGHGTGRRHQVGEIQGRPVLAYDHGRELSAESRTALGRQLWQTVLATSRVGEVGTDPALLLVTRPPPAALYWEAVRRIVTLAEVRGYLAGLKPLIFTAPSQAGLIGAAAALAWRGAHPTWEALAYRSPGRWGSPRLVDPESVRRMARARPGLFLCADGRTRRILVAPHTPCPILFGLRATRPGTARLAVADVESEPVERWMLFRTNQGTGDHIHRPWPLPPVPYSAGTLRGEVRELPEVRKGGHVGLTLATEDGGRVECMVFEPTKTLPRVAAALRPGDQVRLWGGNQGDPVFRVEGIDVLETVPRLRPRPNPECPRCHRRTGSLGQGRGFRCSVCRATLPPEGRPAVRDPIGLARGRYHPTPSARRHLAPLGPG